MPQVESKSNISIDIEVKAGTGEKKGHISLSSGNLYYYRASTKKETALNYSFVLFNLGLFFYL